MFIPMSRRFILFGFSHGEMWACTPQQSANHGKCSLRRLAAGGMDSDWNSVQMLQFGVIITITLC